MHFNLQKSLLRLSEASLSFFRARKLKQISFAKEQGIPETEEGRIVLECPDKGSI